MKPLRVATFNMESLDDRLGADGDFNDRIAVMRPQLRRLRADVLCLQEINAHCLAGKSGPRPTTGLDRLLEQTEYADFHRLISTNQSGLRPAEHHNLVILSRFPLASSRQIRHDLVAPPLYRSAATIPAGVECEAVQWDRPLQQACIDLGDGRRLHVINLHLRAPRAAFVAGQKDERGRWRTVSGWAEGFFLAAVKRAGQALEARMAVDAIFDEDAEALIAVCGDFNSGDHEAPVRIIRGDEEDTGNGRLAGRMLISLERGISESLRFSAVHHGRRIMLDHILASRPLTGFAAGVEIHNEALGDELVGPLDVAGAPDSYHAPMTVEFLFP